MTTNDVLVFDPQDREAALRATLPSFKDPSKTEWLMYRSIGFSDREACRQSGIAPTKIELWRQEDPVFLDWESYKLLDLQRNIGATIVRNKLLRNMFMLMNIDAEVLTKRTYNKEDMTAQDYRELFEAGKRYSPTTIAQVLRLLMPVETVEEKQQQASVEITVPVDGDEIDIQIRRRAAARKLLSDFTQYNNATTIIDVESKVVE